MELKGNGAGQCYVEDKRVLRGKGTSTSGGVEEGALGSLQGRGVGDGSHPPPFGRKGRLAPLSFSMTLLSSS
uniref:Uncharacterized protein n=1 Tax=Physcomitrium patens TaxID=3218 RepID=A0A2K1JT47_PHYPA|nr:hypothetical protein PHYPA_014478 [Physcomitrium patens]